MKYIKFLTLLLMATVFLSSCGLLSSDGKVTVKNNRTGQTIEVDAGYYEAAQEAYKDVLRKFYKYKDVSDCIDFYKSIGANAYSNDEYRNALNSYEKVKREYESALKAYNKTFPEFYLTY